MDPKPLRVVVATHGHCFDGLCSAVMFTRLLKQVHAGQPLDFAYHAMGYGPGQNGIDPKLLTGDVNAILDFRFSSSAALTWYFDHHKSAFPSSGDREAYEKAVRLAAQPHERRMFHDDAYGSCTKLIRDVGAATFDLDPAPTRELVRWADMIDTASFPSAKMAVDREEPVLRLMTVIEQMGDDGFLARMVPRLLEEPVVDVASDADIASTYEPLMKAHEAFVALVTGRARESGGVVLVDLSDQIIEAAGKFVTYALYPSSAYSVLLSRSKSKCKISIGYNPWSPRPRTHDIAAICERYGGGGHAVVGAISTPPEKIEVARALAASIADELRR